MKTSIALLIWILPVIASAQGQPSLVSVVFNPATVTGGTSSTATITISAPARNNGFDVTLSLNSTVASVTSSTITIAEGQSSQTVSVTTSPVATQQVVILSATTRAETKSGSITISPPSISSIAIAPSSVISGQQATATITLTGNAPSSGFPVDLSSSNTVVPVSATVNVPGGQRTGNVPLTTRSVSAQTTVTLTAGASGSSKTTTLTVLPIPLSIVSLQYPTDPVSGARVTRSISLNGYAPAGGTVVEIYAIGPDMLQQNGIIGADTIPAGQMRISRTTLAPTTNIDRAFEIVATLDKTTTRRSGTLRAPTIVSLAIADSVFEGTTTAITADLNGTPPLRGLPVVITSSDPSAIPSPGAVLLLNVDGSIASYVRANDVSTRTPVTLSVERDGVVRRVSTTVIPRVVLLTGITVTPSSVRGGQSVTITATINGPAPIGGTEVKLVEFPRLGGFDVPSKLLIPAGRTSRAVAVATPRVALVPIGTEVKASLGNRTLSARVTINP